MSLSTNELRRAVAAQSSTWLRACLYSNRTCPARRFLPSTARVNAVIRRVLRQRGE
jgi:hypothetical protein